MATTIFKYTYKTFILLSAWMIHNVLDYNVIYYMLPKKQVNFTAFNIKLLKYTFITLSAWIINKILHYFG